MVSLLRALLVFLVLSPTLFASDLPICQKVGGEAAEVSKVDISIVEGPEISMWSIGGVRPGEASVQLQLSPKNPAVIGRATDSRPPYLAAGYTPTQVMPGGGNVLKRNGKDGRLSRAHFMLLAHPQGIIIVNGVPSADGGMRAPPNGTRLLSPEERPMEPGERFLVERNSSVKVQLPNGTILLLRPPES